MLILPIKKKWFDMILSGQKKEEYREIKAYWTSRLGWYDVNTYYKPEYARNMKNEPFVVKFRNGYGSNRPTITCRVILRQGQGKQDWGAEPNKEYYVLEILEILEVQNVS